MIPGPYIPHTISAPGYSTDCLRTTIPIDKKTRKQPVGKHYKGNITTRLEWKEKLSTRINSVKKNKMNFQFWYLHTNISKYI